jgi:hypothetical protein
MLYRWVKLMELDQVDQVSRTLKVPNHLNNQLSEPINQLQMYAKRPVFRVEDRPRVLRNGNFYKPMVKRLLLGRQ